MTGLSIGDYADYELLHVVEDHAGKKTRELAALLDVTSMQCASRLGWMRRMGFLERDRNDGWVLGREGVKVLNGGGDELLALRSLTLTAGRKHGTRWLARREALRNLT